MQPVDHLLILLLFFVQPVYGFFEMRRYKALAASGEALNRVRFYGQTTVAEWLFLAVLVTVWLVFDRQFAGLGFIKPDGSGFWASVFLLILLAGYLGYALLWVQRASADEKAKQVESIGDMAQFLPHTIRELRSFYAVSVTAGIVEEIVYRGFVLWYLTQFMPLWLAIGVSSIAFGLGHIYQGPIGALKCSLVGLAFGVFYVLSGSIWLPIIAHALFDAGQGAAVQKLLQRDDDFSDAQFGNDASSST